MTSVCCRRSASVGRAGSAVPARPASPVAACFPGADPAVPQCRPARSDVSISTRWARWRQAFVRSRDTSGHQPEPRSAVHGIHCQPASFATVPTPPTHLVVQHSPGAIHDYRSHHNDVPIMLYVSAGRTTSCWKHQDELGWQVYDERGHADGAPGSVESAGKGTAGVVDLNGRFILFQ